MMETKSWPVASIAAPRLMGAYFAETADLLLWIAIPVLGITAVAMAVAALVTASADQSKLYLSIAAYLGGLAAFAIGLLQYRRADYWKRSEFLAKEMKEYFADPQVTIALTMIDWGIRRVRLFEPSKDSQRLDSGERRVDRALQCSALRPHTMLRAGESVDPEGPVIAPSSDGVEEASAEHPGTHKDSDTLAGVRFSREEAAIRDCYDRLLDGLDRFGNYVSGSLLTRADLEPYLSYWIKDIASVNCDDDDALWTLYLLAYIEFYSFMGAQSLFRSFGYDITLRGSLAKRLIERCSDQRQVADLLAHVMAVPAPEDAPIAGAPTPSG
jgi:hypothetical protein